MKKNIPKSHTMTPYVVTQRKFDWEKVAFHPYSAEVCQKKWHQILQKIRKIRTLTELIDEAEDVVDDPFKRRKHQIHPEFPKKPVPPNGIFLQENLEEVKIEHPDLSPTQLVRLLNEEYKKLPEHKKAKYIEKFQLASEEYQQRKLELRKQYFTVGRIKPRDSLDRANPDNEPHPEGQATSSLQGDPPLQSRDKLLNFGADDVPVKPPSNGYTLFTKEQRTSMGKISYKVHMTACGQQWREMTQGQKDEYNTRCRKLKKEFEIKLNQYLSTLQDEEQQQILMKYGYKSRAQLLKSTRPLRTGEPKKPSRSGNVVFCSEQMEVLKRQIPGQRERLATIGSMWKKLSAAEKNHYKDKAEDKIKKYTVDLRNWFRTLKKVEQADYRRHNPTQSEFLGAQDMYSKKKAEKYRPSDSEDEDIDDSSSDEEQEENSDSDKDEEEEDEGMILWTHEMMEMDSMDASSSV
ncbi:nucleolar transcription factor 1-like isoform 2-T2 [Polymixia lowei]